MPIRILFSLLDYFQLLFGQRLFSASHFRSAGISKNLWHTFWRGSLGDLFFDSFHIFSNKCYPESPTSFLKAIISYCYSAGHSRRARLLSKSFNAFWRERFHEGQCWATSWRRWDFSRKKQSDLNLAIFSSSGMASEESLMR